MMRENIFDVLDKRWQIMEKFPESGQGASAIIKDNSNKECVVKILKATSTSNVRRFEQEIEI